MKAFSLIRPDPVYRREAFERGLRAAGFDVKNYVPSPAEVQEGDWLVMWNRYGHYHEWACMFEKQGGTVVVVENAYLGVDRANRQRYAIALHGHNGSGAWPMGGPERWEALGITLAPWRRAGDNVLVCPNRSFGRPDMIMPLDWAERTAAELRRWTARPVRIRPHPGNALPPPLDLSNTWAVVIWTSSIGCEALVRGVPVFCTGPYWVCGPAACKDLRKINEHLPTSIDRREYAMNRLAWAQWHIEEIASGTPFQHLLERPSTFAGRV